MKVLDLFSGTGAFSYTFENKGYNIVLSNDILPSSRDIHNLNFKTPFLLKDILEVNVNEIPNHDILCAGFPCQPFSIAGKKKGFNDTRSNVFWKIIEILKFHKPKFILLENVKNLKTHDSGNTFKIIKENLENLGYNLKYSILDTCKITNIPHHRERIYILGSLSENNFSLDFPTVSNLPLNNFLEDNIPEKYFYTEKSKIYKMLKESVIKENVVYQYRRTYVRENKSNCCPTLTANMGSGGHNVPIILNDGKIRKLTPRECFNLQGFPKDYKLPDLADSKLYSLAGNAVSIPVVKLIANLIC